MAPEKTDTSEVFRRVRDPDDLLGQMRMLRSAPVTSPASDSFRRRRLVADGSTVHGQASPEVELLIQPWENQRWWLQKWSVKKRT
jgi:hypothetical protein